MKFEDLKLVKDYKIENAKITYVDLDMRDHGVLTLRMALEGSGWGVVYGGYALGHGYLGAINFDGDPKGIECIERIMDTVGVDRFQDLVGKHVRVVSLSWGDPITIIGHIINDKWFNIETFYKKEAKNG